MHPVRASGLMALVLCSISGTREPTTTVPDEPPATRVVLPNGLTVVLAADHKSPLVGFELRYRAGTRDDPGARPGLAVLMPWLMVSATAHVAEGQYDRLLDAAGAFDARWRTTFDRTTFMVTVPSDELALPLWLWSDQMGFFSSRVDERLIARQLPVVRNEHAQQINNKLEGRVPALVEEELYPPGHPYRGGGLRGTKGLQGLTTAEVRAFADIHYRPERAILVVTGDFETPHALELVRKYFGPIPGRARPAALSASPLILTGETRLQIAARVEAPSVTISWPTASFHELGDAELDLIAELLAGARAGWLRWKLVDQMQIASSVTALQGSRALGSVFSIHAVATAGHGTGELIAAIDGVLRALQSGAPDRHSFQSALWGFLIDRLFNLEQVGKRAEVYADCEDHGIRDACLKSVGLRYTTIDAARVSKIAAQQLPLGHRIIAEVTPTADAPIAGELRGRAVRPQ